MSILNKLFTPILVLSGLLLLMLVTNPYEIHFAVLIVPFFLAGLFVYLTFRIVLTDVLLAEKRLATLVAAGAALTVVFLLSLSSLRQLTLTDIFLTVGFTILTVWYLKRYFFS